MSSRVVFDGATVRIGAFRKRPDEPGFVDSGPARGHLLVFPREPVAIRFAGGRARVADASVVMIYNRGQVYTRAAISPAGDRCEWFGYPGEAVLEARGDGSGDLERPFAAMTQVASDARGYLLARLAYEHVRAGGTDALFVEEIAATLLDHVMTRSARGPAPVSSAHGELADAARRWLGGRFAESWSLEAIAGALGVSAFHLARVFRRATGRSIHGHRTHLRLCAAIERLPDSPDLSALALDLGFSSHSHFAAAFRAGFGVAPSEVRRDPRQAAARLRARS